MSLLTIAQGVARSIKVEVPNTIIGNGSDEAALLLQCAQDEGEALARRPPGGWTYMIRENDFSTVSITLSGVVTNGSAIITGLSSTVGLAALTFYPTGTGIPRNTFILTVDSATQVTLNNAIILAPANSPQTASIVFAQGDYALPSDFERPIDNTYWDRGRFWNMRGPLSPQQWQFYKSSIYGQVAVQRRFRIRNINGLDKFSIDPPPTDNGTPLVFEYVSNGWCKNAGTGAYQTQWLLDTDLGVIDEYLIRLGVKWRALDRLGMDYSSALMEYAREVDKAVAQDGGASTLDMTPPRFPPYINSYSIQDGNFPG